MKDRIKKVHKLMAENCLDGFLVDSPESRYYLSGFTGTAGRILFTEKQDYFLTDFRYVQQANEQTEGYKILEINKNFEVKLNELIQEYGINKLGFESKAVTYQQYEKYDQYIETGLVATQDYIEKLRLIKDDSEIDKIKKAVEISDKTFEHILSFIKPGISERDVALELEFYMKRLGAEKNAFDFIVASGKRSSLPHGVATEKKLENGDFVTMDFGAFYQGYCSDITRTVVIGEASEEQKEIYGIVLDAQLKVIEKTKAAMTCVDVDDIARAMIVEAGYGDNFGHGLGHGIGLEVHEGPRVSFTSEDTLEVGMVVTDEPGIYLPNWGGVRIEDDLLITEQGCQVLNKAPKELIVL